MVEACTVWRDHLSGGFREFGDKIVMWTTFNEPAVMGFCGWLYGAFPPGRMVQFHMAGLHLLNTYRAHAAVYKAIKALPGRVVILHAFAWFTLSITSRQFQFSEICRKTSRCTTYLYWSCKHSQRMLSVWRWRLITDCFCQCTKACSTVSGLEILNITEVYTNHNNLVQEQIMLSDCLHYGRRS